MPKVGKSINLTFFANQLIKPKTITWKGEIVEAYPLYASVLYGNSTSTIKVEKSGWPILVTKDLAQLEELELKEFTTTFSTHVKNVVSKEAEFYGEKYSVVGIGGRLKKYDQSVVFYMTSIPLGKLLSMFLSSYKKVSDDPRMAGDFLFNKLANMFTDERTQNITVFDWIFGNGKESMRAILSKKNITGTKKGEISSDQEINSLLNFVDIVVNGE